MSFEKRELKDGIRMKIFESGGMNEIRALGCISKFLWGVIALCKTGICQRRKNFSVSLSSGLNKFYCIIWLNK